MPKYVNEVTKEIVDYPAEAAALFPALKPVPSERAKSEKNSGKVSDANDKTDVVEPVEVETNKNGATNAK